MERDLRDELRAVSQSRLARQVCSAKKDVAQPSCGVDLDETGTGEFMARLAVRRKKGGGHFGDATAVPSTVDPNAFGAVYMQGRIGVANTVTGVVPVVTHDDVQSYADKHPLVIQVAARAKNYLFKKVATYTQDIRFAASTIAETVNATFAPHKAQPDNAPDSESDDPADFHHGIVEAPHSTKRRVGKFLDSMQRARHKGIVEGSSINDFRKDKMEMALIETPFGASLTQEDAFDGLRKTTVQIHQCNPASVEKAMNSGEYVDTRPAPLVNETQEAARMCFKYLWQRRMEDTRAEQREHVPLAILEKELDWASTTKWSKIRSLSLDNILRNYPEQFDVQGTPTALPIAVRLTEKPDKWQWSKGRPADASSEASASVVSVPPRRTLQLLS